MGLQGWRAGVIGRFPSRGVRDRRSGPLIQAHVRGPIGGTLSRGQVADHQRPEDHGRHRTARNAQRQRGDQRRGVVGIVAAFRRRDTARVAVAEGLGVAGGAARIIVAGKAAWTRSRPAGCPPGTRSPRSSARSPGTRSGRASASVGPCPRSGRAARRPRPACRSEARSSAGSRRDPPA